MKVLRPRHNRRSTRSRRWLRLAIPVALALALIVGTAMVRFLSEPDRSDPSYLSPELSSDISGVDLAELLRAEGVRVDRYSSSAAALSALASAPGRATLFIPTPHFVRPDHLLVLAESPDGTRVVLVEPGAAQVWYAVPGLATGPRRWETAVTGPGSDCPLTGAGRAAVTRTRYSGHTSASCYDRGLVAAQHGEVEFVVAGSADPFRSDRLAEHDNAALAVDLLSTRPALIWLDLHAKETRPRQQGDADWELPDFPPQQERPQPPPPPNPFPDWLLPLVLLLLVAAIALAFARGRRLGPPVTEPLPIEVPGAETAHGRSRLYRRAKARGPALETLRAEARRRIEAALGPFAGQDELLDAVAARCADETSGRARASVTELLSGPAPDNDEDLHLQATELLRLVEQCTKEKP